MNIRKEIDYSTMFAALDLAISMNLPQMELYCEVGKAICARTEKGAAVAAASYLNEQYPDMAGFSPRNVRRMRDFYRIYGDVPELIAKTQRLNWTQNVVILESNLTLAERLWYLQRVAAHGWSKKLLEESIQNVAHLDSSLDYSADLCYTNEENTALESENEENFVYQPDGTISEPGRENDGCHVRAGICMHGENRSSVKEFRLRQLRYSGWNGTGRLAGYVSYLRRRFCWKDVPPDCIHRPPDDRNLNIRSRMLSDISGADCPCNNVIHHKIYNGKYRIETFKNCLCLTFALNDNPKYHIPLTTPNVHEIVMISAMNITLEGELFYQRLSEWDDTVTSGFDKLGTLKHYYGANRVRFAEFLREHQKCVVRGTTITSKRFVKFFFDEEPSNIQYSEWGRTYINYRQQLAKGSIISDIPCGSGLSAGYLDKVFMYFGSCHSYGERLLILRPIKSEQYRLNDYECLGDKFLVEHELTLTSTTSIAYLLGEMSNDAREAFLRCDRGNSIQHWYGQIDSTIHQMKNMDSDRYADAIEYLEELYETRGA